MPKGHFVRSPEHRANIAKANRGLKRSPETCERISKAKTGEVRSAEFRSNMSKRLKGKPSGRIWTDELAANMSAGRKGKTGKLDRYGVSNEEYARQIKAGNKWCIHKRHFAPASGFKKKSSTCSSCSPEYHRQCNIQTKFGVDQDWYDAKLAEQGGGCAVCGSPNPGSSGYRFFAIDHDHKAGGTRGLLCSRCNTSMERIDSYPNWCESAVAYLKQYEGKELPRGSGDTTRPYKRRGKPLSEWGVAIVPPVPVPEPQSSVVA